MKHTDGWFLERLKVEHHSKSWGCLEGCPSTSGQQLQKLSVSDFMVPGGAVRVIDGYIAIFVGAPISQPTIGG
jgi:hypothetical protein